MKMFYEFVGGRLNQCIMNRETVEVIASGKSRSWAVERAQGRLVPSEELDNQPTVAGYLGPMWDGLRYVVGGKLLYEFETTEEQKAGLEPIAILRYESQEVYDMMSN